MERASIFEAVEDVDLSKFKVKTPAHKTEEPAEKDIRAVSEAANFKSREPKAPTAKKGQGRRTREPRVHRTGRNIQLSLKVDAETDESYYQLTERCKKQYGWVAGETLKRALQALQNELNAAK